jgi:hypothetical protein
VTKPPASPVKPSEAPVEKPHKTKWSKVWGAMGEGW